MRKAVIILAGAGLAALIWQHARPAARQVRLERRLLDNLERTFTTDGNTLAELQAAVRLTFPGSDARKITAYALFQLAPADANGGHSRLTRDEWARKVVTFAIRQEQAR
jgi:hypothetical protein